MLANRVQRSALVKEIASRSISFVNVFLEKVDFALQLGRLIASRRLFKDLPRCRGCGILDGALPVLVASILAFPRKIHAHDAETRLFRVRQDVILKEACRLFLVQVLPKFVNGRLLQAELIGFRRVLHLNHFGIGIQKDAPRVVFREICKRVFAQSVPSKGLRTRTRNSKVDKGLLKHLNGKSKTFCTFLHFGNGLVRRSRIQNEEAVNKVFDGIKVGLNVGLLILHNHIQNDLGRHGAFT